MNLEEDLYDRYRRRFEQNRVENIRSKFIFMKKWLRTGNSPYTEPMI